MGGRQIDLAALYREVGRRGGAEAVSNRKWWKAVGARFPVSAAAEGAEKEQEPVLSVLCTL